MLAVCGLPALAQQVRLDPQQGFQQDQQGSTPKPIVRPESEDASKADSIEASVLLPLDSTSPLAPSALSQVQGSFKIYPDAVGSLPLPTNGTWSVPVTPLLAFLPACTADKASCLEVEYSVPSRKIICLWTVLFPAPTVVNGKQVQVPTVINEETNAAKYFMLVRLQAGMNYASVAVHPPVYPPSPKAADWTGSVSLDIVVSPQGKVVSIQAVRGPKVMQPSARLAVAKWVYGQTKVGSQAVARSFTVQVNYSVGGATIKK